MYTLVMFACSFNLIQYGPLIRLNQYFMSHGSYDSFYMHKGLN